MPLSILSHGCLNQLRENHQCKSVTLTSFTPPTIILSTPTAPNDTDLSKSFVAKLGYKKRESLRIEGMDGGEEE